MKRILFALFVVGIPTASYAIRDPFFYAKRNYVTPIVTEEQFDELVMHNDVPTVIMFYTNGCPHCKAAQKPYEDVARKFSKSNVVFAKIETGDLPEIAAEYEIDAVPEIVYTKQGKVTNFDLGYDNLGQFKANVYRNTRKLIGK